MGKFDRAAGIQPVKTAVPSYTDVFGDTLCDLARKDARIHGITAAMPSGTGLGRLREESRGPRRYDTLGLRPRASGVEAEADLSAKREANARD